MDLITESAALAIGWWEGAVASIQAWLVHPVLSATGLSALVPDQAGFAEAILIGLAQVAVIALVFRPLETIAPLERWPDRRYARVDIAHTLFNLWGLVPLGTYLVLIPLGEAVARLTGAGDGPGWNLSALVPWLKDKPFALFLVYFVILDFAAYVMHRLQHELSWWWAMHSLHHSQVQMSVWTDDRGSIVDHILQAVFVGLWGLVIGVSPVEYGLIVFLGKMVENFSHCNTRLRFGVVLDKLLVDPRFHRHHHMVADPAFPDRHNCNFSFTFPIWDILFRTALYDPMVRPTGVDDPAIMADNELGWVGQQRVSLDRLGRALAAGLLRTTHGSQRGTTGDDGEASERDRRPGEPARLA